MALLVNVRACAAQRAVRTPGILQTCAPVQQHEQMHTPNGLRRSLEAKANLLYKAVAALSLRLLVPQLEANINVNLRLVGPVILEGESEGGRYQAVSRPAY